MSVITRIFIGVLLLQVTGCTWVKKTEEAEQVSLIKPNLAKHCEKLASTTVKVAAKVGFVERNEKKVGEELTTQAKNEAALIGGDAIVSDGPAKDGIQKFSIYRCGGA